MSTQDDAPIWPGHKKDDTPESALAREDLVKRIAREHRRLLYVALTRAQDRLIIFGTWHGNRPKTEEQRASKDGFHTASWYALCAEAMRGLLGDDIPMAETGRPAFARFGPTPTSGRDGAARNQSATEPPDWLFTKAAAKEEQTRMAAPSHLLAQQSPVLPPLSENRKARLRRGRLIHALLERLPALPSSKREAAGYAFLAQDSDLTADVQDDILSAAMGVINDPQFADVFAEDGRAEAAIVGQSDTLPTGLVINGIVDRLVVSDTDVLIVDFKTDRPPPALAEDVSEAYLVQMAAYGAVLGTAYPDHKIRCAIVWTDGPKLMELPSDLLANAISRLSPAV